MSKYYVEFGVEFTGYVEADSELAAETLAWRDVFEQRKNALLNGGLVRIIVEEAEEQ